MRRRKRRHPNGLTQDDFDKALALLYPADGPAAPSEADLTGVPFDWESLSAGDRDMLLSANRDDGQRLSASRWQPDHRAAAVLYGEADLPQASAATMMLDAPQLTHVQKTPSDITERPNTSQVHSSRGSSRGSGSFLSRFAAPLCILAGLAAC